MHIKVNSKTNKEIMNHIIENGFMFLILIKKYLDYSQYLNKDEIEKYDFRKYHYLLS